MRRPGEKSGLLPDSNGLPRGDNMIPMINIVFLLLIFFMVAGTVSNQTTPDIVLPNSALGTEVTPDGWRLVLQRDDSPVLNGTALPLPQLDKALSVKAGAAPEIQLFVDRQVTARELDGVLQVLRKHQVTNLKLMVNK
jgi:biopolymer transport protein ExbD